MNGRGAKAKGANGERQLAKWLHRNLQLPEEPVRNLEQVRSGGADILGVGKFIFECKRCESLNIDQWWLQVLEATDMESGEHPVLAYRQNRKPWTFVVSARVIGLPRGKISMDENTFALYAKQLMEAWAELEPWNHG